jgi:hypothetical protein
MTTLLLTVRLNPLKLFQLQNNTKFLYPWIQQKDFSAEAFYRELRLPRLVFKWKVPKCKTQEILRLDIIRDIPDILVL